MKASSFGGVNETKRKSKNKTEMKTVIDDFLWQPIGTRNYSLMILLRIDVLKLSSLSMTERNK
jgi:hypothetical protein